MKKIITLKNPLKINGEYVSTLTYDTDEIDGALYCAAEARRAAAMKASGVSMGDTIDPAMLLAEFNSPLHLYLGFAAVIAINPNIDWDDLERVKGSDINKFRTLGRFFIKESEDSEDETSEKDFESTLEPSTATDSSLSDDA